jgi:hypothetical protein
MLTFTTSQMANWKSAPRASRFPIASSARIRGQPHRHRREQALGPRSCHHQSTARHVFDAEGEHEQSEARAPKTRSTDLRLGLRSENPCEICERRLTSVGTNPSESSMSALACSNQLRSATRRYLNVSRLRISFTVECLHRIDVRGSSCGKEASSSCTNQKHKHNRSEHPWRSDARDTHFPTGFQMLSRV